MEVRMRLCKANERAVAAIGILDIESFVVQKLFGSFYIVRYIASSLHCEPLQNHQAVILPLLIELSHCSIACFSCTRMLFHNPTFEFVCKRISVILEGPYWLQTYAMVSDYQRNLSCHNDWLQIHAMFSDYQSNLSCHNRFGSML